MRGLVQKKRSSQVYLSISVYEETTSSSSLIHTSISLYCILCYLVINFQKLWTFLKVFAKAFIRTICYDVDDTYILRNKSERSNESTLKESIINCQYKKMLQCDLALDFFSVYFLLKKGAYCQQQLLFWMASKRKSVCSIVAIQASLNQPSEEMIH